MTLQEILKAKGLSDEDVEAVIGEMKQNKIFTASEENLDIRYGKLKTDHDALTAEHGESTKLIEQLKAAAKGNEGIQQKITEYESQIADLTKQLGEQKLDAAMDRMLTAAGARPEDFDYLKFQWHKKGDIVLDENGEIKGGDDAIAGMKTQFPNQFATAKNGIQIDANPLPENNSDITMTRSELLKKPYAERAAFANDHPDAYKEIMNQ